MSIPYKKKSWMLFVILILLLGTVMVGCSSPSETNEDEPAATSATETGESGTDSEEVTDSEDPATTDVEADSELAEVQLLRFGTVEEDAPDGFDPTLSTNTPNIDLQKIIYSSLVRLIPDARNNEDLEPDLATSWETSEDGLTWTFELRKGVQFQKGYGELTSEDVVFSLDRARAEGASWRSVYTGVDTIEAVDEYTVRITLTGPDPYFLYKMSNAGNVSSVIVSKKAVEEFGDDYPFNPIGTGPFQFESYIPKQKLVFTRHEDYFRGSPILETIEYFFIPESQAMTAALQAGELDFAEGQQDAIWTDLVAGYGYTILDGPPFVIPLAFNLTMEPFDDLRVRQAIFYAIDRSAFADFYGEDFVFVGDPNPAFTPWPWHMDVYEAARDVVPKYEYDQDKARELLAEAGYPDGFSLDLTWTNQSRFLEPIQIVQAQLAEVGVDLNLNIVEHSAYREVIDGVGQEMSMISISRDTPDEVAREWFHSSAIPPDGSAAKYNYAHYGEVLPGVDELIEMAFVEMDPDVRRQLYVEIQEQVMTDLPIIVLFQGLAKPFVVAPYVDMGYEWHAPDRRYPPFDETSRILAH